MIEVLGLVCAAGVIAGLVVLALIWMLEGDDDV